jgi:hypothetical protein
MLHQGGYDVYKGPRNLGPAITSGAQWPVNEPLAVVPAMAAATKNIGFGVTVTTTYEPPYHLARRLSTVDHLTKGRYVQRLSSPIGDSKLIVRSLALGGMYVLAFQIEQRRITKEDN